MAYDENMVAIYTDALSECSPKVLVGLLDKCCDFMLSFGLWDPPLNYLDDFCEVVVRITATHDEAFAVKVAKRASKLHYDEANQVAFEVLRSYLGTGGPADHVLWGKVVKDKMGRLETVYYEILDLVEDKRVITESWLDEHGYGESYRHLLVRWDRYHRKLFPHLYT